jgi:uncharacterized membrane protein YjfL (UPF0719 family)
MTDREAIGEYCLDLSKLVFGGAILSSILKEELPLWWICCVGGVIFVILAIIGFKLTKTKKRKEIRENNLIWLQ